MIRFAIRAIGCLLALTFIAVGVVELHNVFSEKSQWRRITDVTAPTGNLHLKSPYVPEKGIQLKVTKAGENKSVRVHLRPSAADSRIRLTPDNAFAERIKRGVHLQQNVLPHEPHSALPLRLKFRKETWGLYLNERQIARFPAPFLPPATISAPAKEAQEGKIRTSLSRKITDFRFHDAFMIPEDQEKPLSHWNKVSGEWRLHQVKATKTKQAEIDEQASRKLTPERSPNFYSLTGKGQPGLITTGHDFYDYYNLQAATEVSTGKMGLAFYVRAPDNFFAYTLEKNEKASHYATLRLWRQQGEKQFTLWNKQIAAPDGQWLKLRIQLFPGRIACFLDREKIATLPLTQPLGGKFGLYVKSSEHARFDDVEARRNHNLSLEKPERLVHHTLLEEGDFFDYNDPLSFLTKPPPEYPLTVPARDHSQRLVFGSAHHENHVVSARFDFTDNTGTAGLIAGYSSRGDPYYRFTCTNKENKEIFRLLRVKNESAKELEKLVLTSDHKKLNNAFTLMADMTSGNQLRLYRNDELVLVHRFSQPVSGASGLFVGPKSSVHLDNIRYQTRRQDTSHNHFEKRRAFVEDRFMRHWSSPEGKWIQDKEHEDRHWFKSDFFGRFVIRLPYIENTAVFPGVKEGRTRGTIRIKADENSLRVTRRGDDKPGAENIRTLAKAPISELKNFDANMSNRENKRKWYSIRYEGYWLWITSGNRVVLKVRLPRPLQGRRLRLQNFTYEQLEKSYVRRYNVKDFLFTESLHNWMTNGGRWRVVNRFQCDPKWSHLNGQSKTGLAALWGKYKFRGDFCIEMYAGMRHRWYQRPGDLNITIMNQDTTPAQGYTVTTTGWDRDHSQRLTRLYKNGEILAETDKYLVPRVRAGKERKGYTPLLPGKRDVHGAWYYIKLRRIDDTLKFYFDNELVFSVEDPSPVKAGSMGIWTYMNSMMVARVKVAAEHIEPERYELPPPASAEPSVESQRDSSDEETSADGDPLNVMTPAYWQADSPVAQGKLLWDRTDKGDRFFRFRNYLGSGSTYTAAQLPAHRYSKIAGWRFYVKRTNRARFNFHYAIGVKEQDDKFEEKKAFYHQISGNGFSKGEYKKAGKSSVSGVDRTGPDWYKQGEWHKVTVWLPAGEKLGSLKNADDLYVKPKGFGNLQPSYTAQGLNGNGPGQGYAIKNFHKILYSAPKNLTNKNTEAIDLPDTLELQAQWKDSPPPTAIQILNKVDYPDRRFLEANVSANGIRLPELAHSPTSRSFVLPRNSKLTRQNSEKLRINIDTDAAPDELSLQWSKRKKNTPPVLLDLQGITALFTSFEKQKIPSQLQFRPRMMSLDYGELRESRYLNINNMGRKRRLRTAFNGSWHIPRFPALFFRYRGGPMTRVSIGLNNHYQMAFSEDFDHAVTARFAPEPALDEQWHQWFGVGRLPGGRRPLTQPIRNLSQLMFKSYARRDQTGLYSSLSLDNLAVGPAVNSKDQLACLPHYFDHDGVSHIEWSITTKAKPYQNLSASHRKELQWQKVDPGDKITPQIQHLKDGLHFLLLRATDRKGTSSNITNVPLLLDRETPDISHEFVSSDKRNTNGTMLRVTVNTGRGAPLDLSRMKFNWDGEPVQTAPTLSSVEHKPDRDILWLNYPHIFHRQLNRTKDGEKHRIGVRSLGDGAGNTTDFQTTYEVNHADDDTAPTVLAADYPDNVLWHLSLKPPRNSGGGFAARHTNRDINSRFMRFTTRKKKKGKAFHKFRDKKWKVTKHPWFAFHIRRPEQHEDTKISLDVVCNKGRRLQISLTPGKDNKSKLSNPIQWSTDQENDSARWHRRIVNLNKLLTRQIRREVANQDNDMSDQQIKQKVEHKLENLHIKRLTIHLRNTSTDFPVDLRSLFVLGPWSLNENSKVKLNGFDASGLEGIRLQADQEKKSLSNLRINVQNFLQSDISSNWLSAKLVDKAGNRSAQTFIPLQPSSSEE